MAKSIGIFRSNSSGPDEGGEGQGHDIGRNDLESLGSPEVTRIRMKTIRYLIIWRVRRRHMRRQIMTYRRALRHGTHCPAKGFGT